MHCPCWPLVPVTPFSNVLFIFDSTTPLSPLSITSTGWVAEQVSSLDLNHIGTFVIGIIQDDAAINQEAFDWLGGISPSHAWALVQRCSEVERLHGRKKTTSGFTSYKPTL